MKNYLYLFISIYIDTYIICIYICLSFVMQILGIATELVEIQNLHF